MFGGAGPGPRGNPRASRLPQLGIVLLLYNILASVGITRIPPVTLSLVALQAAIFTGYFDPGYGYKSDVALNAHRILHYGEYSRLIFCHLEHLSDLHLYYNCMSLIYKGISLEKRLGSFRFLLVVILFGVSGAFMYVLLAMAASDLFRDGDYLRESALGFSLILFALKVLVNYYDYHPNASTNQFGFEVPRRMAIWTELILIQILVPNASFLGHLAGILVGILFVHLVLPVLRVLANPRENGLYFPWTTLALAGILAAQHFNYIKKPWATRHFWDRRSSLVCLSAYQVLFKSGFWRLISAPMEHLSDVHLGMCLLSFVIKGTQLEQRRGGLRFVLTSTLAIIGTSVSYVLLAKLWSIGYEDNEVLYDCVQGLSGALFALKVPCLLEAESLITPSCLFELFEMIILMEDSNRLWHVSGLVVGLILHLWRGSRFPGTGIRLDGTRPTSSPGWTRSWGYAGRPDLGPRSYYDYYTRQEQDLNHRRNNPHLYPPRDSSSDELDNEYDDQDESDASFQSNSEADYSSYEVSSSCPDSSVAGEDGEEESSSAERMRRSVTPSPSLAPRSKSMPVGRKARRYEALLNVPPPPPPKYGGMMITPGGQSQIKVPARPYRRRTRRA